MLPCGVSVTVAVVIVAAFIASEKVAITLVVVVWPPALAAGVTDVTVGGVVSTEAVVNVQTRSVASGFPARSFTPAAPDFTVAV